PRSHKRLACGLSSPRSRFLGSCGVPCGRATMQLFPPLAPARPAPGVPGAEPRPDQPRLACQQARERPSEPSRADLSAAKKKGAIMSMLETLKARLITAMKQGQTLEKDLLRVVLGEASTA